MHAWNPCFSQGRGQRALLGFGAFQPSWPDSDRQRVILEDIWHRLLASMHTGTQTLTQIHTNIIFFTWKKKTLKLYACKIKFELLGTAFADVESHWSLRLWGTVTLYVVCFCCCDSLEYTFHLALLLTRDIAPFPHSLRSFPIIAREFVWPPDRCSVLLISLESLSPFFLTPYSPSCPESPLSWLAQQSLQSSTVNVGQLETEWTRIEESKVVPCNSCKVPTPGVSEWVKSALCILIISRILARLIQPLGLKSPSSDPHQTVGLIYGSRWVSSFFPSCVFSLKD